MIWRAFSARGPKNAAGAAFFDGPPRDAAGGFSHTGVYAIKIALVVLFAHSGKSLVEFQTVSQRQDRSSAAAGQTDLTVPTKGLL